MPKYHSPELDRLRQEEKTYLPQMDERWQQYKDGMISFAEFLSFLVHLELLHQSMSAEVGLIRQRQEPLR